MRRIFLLVLLLLSLLSCMGAMAEDTAELNPMIQITLQEAPYKGYQINDIDVSVSVPGSLTLKVSDDLNTYRIIADEAVTEGKYQYHWDGLGMYLERLQEKEYRFEAELILQDGTAETAAKSFALSRCLQALIFALPSDSLIYQADNDWYIEYDVIRDGTMIFEVYEPDRMQEPIYTKKLNALGKGVRKITWAGKKQDKELLPQGDYLLRLYMEDNPAYTAEIPVTVKAGNRPVKTVQLTGPIMPDDSMSDEEIWRLMTADAVVVDLKDTSHQKVFSQPSKDARVLGTLHGQSQTLQVFEIREGWVKIGAWQHEDASYVVGWVPSARLKVVAPQQQYGLMLDKRDQTLTVFEKGKRIGTIRISTGKVAKNKLFQQTAAGSFLTLDHMYDFSTNGHNYDYVIRYDGGNLLHQAAWTRTKDMHDFSEQGSVLGQKASHGCVRIEPLALHEGDINAYWIFTHVPYHTRVLVLDDQEQRMAEAAAAQAGREVILSLPEPETLSDEQAVLFTDEVVLTVGGDAVVGTREIWWADEDSFPSLYNRNDPAYFFQKLQPIFAADDMTFINLECTLKDDKSGEDKSKEYRFRGLPSFTDVLTSASVEQVNIANNHVIDYGDAGKSATIAALEAAKLPFSGYENLYICEIKGHRIGFAGCRETVYRKDKEIIAREITSLREQGCQVIIYSCHWGTEYTAAHNDIQKAMAMAASSAGADIVIGNHPHVVQGIEQIDDTVVLYSLGNLMFGGTRDMKTFDAALARLKLHFSEIGYEGVSVTYIPILTSSSTDEYINDFCPIPAEDVDAQRIIAKIRADSPFEIRSEMYFEKSHSVR